MKRATTLIALLLCMGAMAIASGVPLARSTALLAGDRSLDDGKGTPWIVDRADSICGLDDPRVLSNPAKVDYQALLDVTPEVKLMKREKVSADSARGIQLMNEAESRVRDKCEKVRADKGYCSVWKSISRRDKKKIDDLTDLVKKEIGEVEGA